MINFKVLIINSSIFGRGCILFLWLLPSRTTVSSSCAFVFSSFFFNSFLYIFEFDFTFLNIASRRHNILSHSFIDHHCNGSLVHWRNCKNFIILDIPGYKFKFIQVSFNMDFIIIWSITCVLKWFIPETSPKEWNFSAWSLLTNHI